MSATTSSAAQRTCAAEGLRASLGELGDALGHVLSRALPARRIAEAEIRPMPYASSFTLHEISVRFDDGGGLELVCKDTSDAAMLPDAMRIKPRFLYSPTREIATYESILAPLGVDAPRFYGKTVDVSRGRYWLFLERVSGQPLTEIGDFDAWRETSGWLARMHDRVASEAALARVAATASLVRYDRAHWRQWLDRAQRHVSDVGDDTGARRRRFARLASKYEAVVDEMAALPTGFVHGEFFPSNVLAQRADAGIRVRPIDWELAGIGPAFMDLAALIAGRWSDGARTELAMSYYTALDRNGERRLTRESFLRALDCCRLQVAVQQLGWATQWRPPAAHTHDWLGDALHAAERLGLA